MKHLPYRNTTYQVIRSACEQPNFYDGHVKLLTSDRLYGTSLWHVSQLAHSPDPDQLKPEDMIMSNLFERGIVVVRIEVWSQEIRPSVFRFQAVILTRVKANGPLSIQAQESETGKMQSWIKALTRTKHKRLRNASDLEPEQDPYKGRCEDEQLNAITRDPDVDWLGV